MRFTFIWLTLVLAMAVIALIAFAVLFKGTDQFVQGIVFTAIAGVVSSLLSFVGMIIKKLVDQ